MAPAFLRSRSPLSAIVGCLLALAVSALAFPLNAQVLHAVDSVEGPVAVQQAYLARIELHTREELLDVLSRSEQLFAEGEFEAGGRRPVAVVLHGPEARLFLRQGYRANRQLVDWAARLSAMEMVDIKVCETWLGGEALEVEQLLPFIGTVPFGPGEERRLLDQQGHIYF